MRKVQRPCCIDFWRSRRFGVSSTGGYLPLELPQKKPEKPGEELLDLELMDGEILPPPEVGMTLRSRKEIPRYDQNSMRDSSCGSVSSVKEVTYRGRQMLMTPLVKSSRSRVNKPRGRSKKRRFVS